MGRRPIGHRAKRWKLKTSPELFHPRLESQHEISSELIKQAYNSIDSLTAKVRTVLDSKGVFGQFRVPYRCFAEELWSLKSKFTEQALYIAAEAVANKYKRYGCNTEVLVEVAALLGIEVVIEEPPLWRNILEEELDERRLHRVLSLDEPIQGTLTLTGLDLETELVKSELGIPHYLEGYLDLTNLASGDSLTIRFYVKLKEAGSYVVYDEDVKAGAQDKPALYIVTKPSNDGLKITLEQTSGTPRAFDYMFLRKRVAY